LVHNIGGIGNYPEKTLSLMRQQFAGPFLDRTHAGQILSNHLIPYRGYSNLLVLGLSRGGMPVAFEVATALSAPLDMFLVRKLPAPGRPDRPIGAIASGGIRILNREVMRELGVGIAMAEAITARERIDLARRELQYRDGRPAHDVRGKVVVLVDDGMATGSTMRAAIAALRERSPEKLVVALPVAERSSCEALQKEADEVVCGGSPEPFIAVARWYRDFSPVMDRKIQEMLQQASREDLCMLPG
jgi:putative phosphoribosyl transferase